MTLEKQLTQMFMDSPQLYRADFEETQIKVATSKAMYKGEPVPYLYIPKFYSPEDIKTFEYALAGMHGIAKRTIDLYLSKPEVRELFDFDPLLEELIELPHFYDVSVPMGRFDIFYYGPGEFMFCELNADGASAMNEEHELSQILSQTQLVQSLSGVKLKRYELFHSWVKAVSQLYKTYQDNLGIDNPKPTVAIVDFIDKCSSIEFNVFKAAFEEAGYPCLIVDPRDISVRNGRMMVAETTIDIVYRRLVTKDLMDRYSEIPEFIEGLKAQKTCVIGPIKTQVIHTKKFFEVLHHEGFRQYLTAEELAFVDAHVPFTRKLMPSDLPTYLADKNHYIIKPVDYYASKGVCAGLDYSDFEWEKLLLDKAQENYLIQKYCPLALVDNVRQNAAGEFEAREFSTITGLFTYNEALAGVYVRAGLHAIISGLHEGYTLSTLVVSDAEA